MRCTQYGSCARDAPGPFKFKKNSETRGIATNKSIDPRAIYTTRKLMRNDSDTPLNMTNAGNSTEEFYYGQWNEPAVQPFQCNDISRK